MRMSRRTFLSGTCAGAGLLLAGAPARASGHWGKFDATLRIPSLLEGTLSSGVRHFELSAQAGRSKFLDDLSTPTMGFNGAYLGPTLRCRSGERVRIKVTNALREATAVHWHGLHVPARMDGGPRQAIAAGATWEPEFEIKQRGSLCWYHSHAMHRTGYQVLHGLAGLLLVDDEENRAAGLPSEYGVDDIPLVLQDRRFMEDGRFDYLTSMHDTMMGFAGDVLLVNGTARPMLALQRQRTRLRILNGSNSRIYTLGRDDGEDLVLVASDGGLLEAPARTRRIRLAPGERVEVIVDARPESAFRLISYPDLSAGGVMGMAGNAETFPVLELRAGKLDAANAPLPSRLSTVRQWKVEDSTATRVFSLDMGMMGGMMGRGMGPGMGGMMGRGMGPGMGGMMGINGAPMDVGRVDVQVPLGNVEVWDIVNRTPLSHPFHIHNVQFRVLARSGSPLLAHESGLKDTVVVEPGSRVRVITQFEDFADPKHPYMYHCHNLEHEDAGMMGQFVVV